MDAIGKKASSACDMACRYRALPDAFMASGRSALVDEIQRVVSELEVLASAATPAKQQ